MLGSSLGVVESGKFCEIRRTSFGELMPDASCLLPDQDFFTGKPQVEGLGYSFLFRNYRADVGKWQSSDPLGYPDGWNNFAYCGNAVVNDIDILGLVGFVEGHAFVSLITENGYIIHNQKVGNATELMDLISVIELSAGKITDFSLRAHGNDDGNVSVGETILNSETTYDDTRIGLNSLQAKQILCESFAKDANIIIESCYQGLENGIARTISQILPTATVTGFTGPVTDGRGAVPSFPGLFWLLTHTRRVQYKNGQLE
jgi:RHS repeat-associated protein